jgi:ATP-dependent Lhr-like helicase
VEAASPPDARAATERLHAVALALLERYGVVTRAAVVAEGVPGGFSAIYPVFRAMEDAGRVRRGYFVEGLGAAQFALPGAVDRLRAVRDTRGEDPVVHVVAAADPASPWGGILPWPRRDPDADRRVIARAAGAHVVLVEGVPVLVTERGTKGIVTLPAFDDPATAVLALRSLDSLAAAGHVREVVVARVDGDAVAASPHHATLEEAGFVPAYRGMALRGPGPGAGGLPAEAAATARAAHARPAAPPATGSRPAAARPAGTARRP